MVHFLVRHKVKDYEQWKEAFEEHSSVRRDAGSKGGRIFRNGSDPQDVAVLLEWDDMIKAKTFLESPYLQHTMEKAGVIGKPETFFEVLKVDV
jgi:hypothetical protein